MAEPRQVRSAAAALVDSRGDDVDIRAARDDPTTLRTYLDRFNPDFEGLTGPLDDITSVADAVHITIEKGHMLPSGGYEVTHSTPVLGVTPDGQVPIVWTQDTSAAKIAADIHTILTDGIATSKEGS